MTSNPEQATPPPQEEYTAIDLPRIVRQLEDLVKLALECEEKDLSPNISFVDVHKKLLQIRRQVDQFKQNFQDHLALLNLRPEDIKAKPEDIQNLGPKEQQIFEKLQSLQTTCEEARDRIKESLNADQAALLQIKEELKDKSSQKTRRKGKFKGIGGKQGWIPT